MNEHLKSIWHHIFKTLIFINKSVHKFYRLQTSKER